MKYLSLGMVLIGLFISCSGIEEEGFLGEWEGTTERVSSSGKPIESEVTCIIKSTSGLNRSVKLTVGGINFEFEAKEEMNMLLFKDIPLGQDSSVMSYISGSAELINDTLLHFDHEVYTLKNMALTGSEEYVLDLTRK